MSQLKKDGGKAVNIGYYKELLFQKIDSNSEAIIRVLSQSAPICGRVVVVGISEMVIETEKGNKTIPFEDMLDIS